MKTLNTILAALLALALVIPAVPAEAKSKTGSKRSSYGLVQKKPKTYSGYTSGSHKRSKGEDCDFGDLLEGDEDCEGLVPVQKAD